MGVGRFGRIASGGALLLALAGRAAAFSLDLPGSPHAVFNAVPMKDLPFHAQLVYAATLFPAGSYAIHSLALSPASDGTVSGSVMLRMGPTAAAVDGLQANLALNDTSLLVDAFSDAAFSRAVIGGADSYSLVFALPSPVSYSTASGNFMAEFVDQLNQITFCSSTVLDAGDGGSRAVNEVQFGNYADTVAPRIRLELTPLELRPPGPHDGFVAVPFAAGSHRYQFVYGADWFPPEPIEIVALALSPELSGVVDAGIEIDLGVTSAAVDGLSDVLDSNISSPLTNVFQDRGFLQSVTGGAESFSLRFPLSRPFVYDPSAGNLLVEFRTQSVVNEVSVSESEQPGDRASGAGDDKSLGSFVFTTALRLRLELAPEPDASLAAAVVLAALAAISRRR